MFTNQSADISLEAPCRALDAIRAERLENLWITATCAFRGTNSLSVLQFQPDLNELTIVATFDMETSTRCILSSPTDSNLLVTAPEQGPSVTLWKLPSVQQRSDDTEYNASSSSNMDRSNNNNSNTSNLYSDDTLQSISTLMPDGGFGANIVDVAWQDSSSEDSSGASCAGELLTLDTNGHLTQWDVETMSQVHAVDTADGAHTHSSCIPPPRVAWDPHASGTAVAVTTGRSVSILDWRTDTSVPTGTCTQITSSASSTHRGITDIDYNPNKPYVLATAGYDGTAKVWDLRHAKRPIMTARGGHTHWVSRVLYNPAHDQLVLTTGTDSVANLWRLSTCSSAPLLQDTTTPTMDGDAESATAAPNVRVARHAQHSESIYAAAWGAADSWIYLTMAYDGKAMLHHVPSKEKYKILL